MPVSKPPRKKSSPQKKTKREVDTSIMKDLASAEAECRNMLAETAKFSPYLTNRALVEAGDMEQIHDNSKILSRDTIQMKNELDAIVADTPKKIAMDNPEHLVKGLSIGDRYHEWQEKYQRAILPTLERLGELLKEAGENLNQSKEEVKADDDA